LYFGRRITIFQLTGDLPGRRGREFPDPSLHTPITKMRIRKLSFRAIAASLFFAFFFLPSLATSQQGVFRLAPPITDNMVLQQQSLAPLWGRGEPGMEVSLQASWGSTVTTRVGADSCWMLKLNTPVAGGPYELTLRHEGATLTIKNVLVGEVWLCSGQSNMEMPLVGWPPGDTVRSWAQEIENSSLPSVRLFTVQRAFSAVPESECSGAWVECSPATSRDFSATAYFFGKKLYETLHVPIGLIHSSWGGTAVHSWIGADFLSRASQFDTTLQKIRQSADGQRRLVAWLHHYPVIDMRTRKGKDRWKGLSFRDEACPTGSFDDGSWRVMHLPTLWEAAEVGSFDGVVWFRKQVAIPATWIDRNLVLELGPIDDIDETFVNGVKVGGHEEEGEYNVKRVYEVPGRIIDSTVVEIAVRVIDFQGGGGIYGDPKSMALHVEGSEDRISLAGDWKYLPVAEYLANVLYVFGPVGDQYETRPRLPIDLSAYTPTALYNGMIAPLIPYSIRGVIWYQGESDTWNPKQYRQLFPLLIENWRHDFEVGDFPFYYVQIAPYEYGPSTQSQYLREAQTATLPLKNTGMAVTLDIGNAKNIHPADKQDVGLRLALWALAKTYEREVPYSGPLLSSVTKNKHSIELVFDHAEGGLEVRGGPSGNGFQIAGADRIFKDALVRVRGNRLIVSGAGITSPQAVRYAFSNAPEATLFNKVGLPAPSFRTDDWEENGR
jgi:sialate O-acetylesterase